MTTRPARPRPASKEAGDDRRADTPRLSRSLVTRLEKAATDNGFDLERPPQGPWLAFASTHAPLQVWLTSVGEDRWAVAMSQRNVDRALLDHGDPLKVSLPAAAAVAARAVQGVPALHRLLRRAFQLSRTLPDELLRVFEQKVASLPKATEAERLVLQRVGQDLFRKGLLEYWDGRCAITGLDVPDLLRASHIRPWADCATDEDRLCVYNGLLLAPHLDAAFDRGYLTVADTGDVLLSTRLSPTARHLRGLDRRLHIARLEPAHRAYLPWHRTRIFLDARSTTAGADPAT